MGIPFLDPKDIRKIALNISFRNFARGNELGDLKIDEEEEKPWETA